MGRKQLLIALGMAAAVALCLALAFGLGLTFYPTAAALVWLAVRSA